MNSCLGNGALELNNERVTYILHINNVAYQNKTVVFSYQDKWWWGIV
jgi:hypothetical protein